MAQQILNLDELSALERRFNNLLPQGELMRRAGRAVADKILELRPEAQHIVIVCGPGNNGGDGFAAALFLKNKGKRVTCALIGCDKPKAEDALMMYEAWVAAGGVVIADPYSADKADVVVDAIFGTGMKKALSGDFLDAAMWFNERRALRVSVDLPTGIDAMTGRWVGGIPGCHADLTMAMLAPKAGCYMCEGADAAGEVVVNELDVSVPLSTLGIIDQSDFRHVCEPRDKNSHKGTYGSVTVVGGENGTIGAALLAARAALVLGAGRVTVEMMGSRAPAFDPVYPELMFAPEAADLAASTCNVVGCGMGFGDRARERLEAAIASPAALVLDADALRMMAQDQSLQDAVLARRSHTVITPHPGEAAAILRTSVEKVNADRITACRELSLQTGAISILKGAGSVIALRSSRTWINPTGNAMLATAGSGDVLSGMLGALFAQHYDLVSATLGAVYLHGAASEGVYAGLTAGEIAANAAAILDEMRANFTR